MLALRERPPPRSASTSSRSRPRPRRRRDTPRRGGGGRHLRQRHPRLRVDPGLRVHGRGDAGDHGPRVRRHGAGGVGEGVTGVKPGDAVTAGRPWPAAPARPARPAGRRNAVTARSSGSTRRGIRRRGDGAGPQPVPVRPGCPSTSRRSPSRCRSPSTPSTWPDVSPGDRVVVLGPGPIGLGIAWVARGRGARLLLVGLDDAQRLATARRTRPDGLRRPARREPGGPRCGGCSAMRPTGDRGDGRRRARSATGSRCCGPGGIVVAAGIHSTPLSLDLTGFVRSKKQLRAPTTPRRAPSTRRSGCCRPCRYPGGTHHPPAPPRSGGRGVRPRPQPGRRQGDAAAGA